MATLATSGEGTFCIDAAMKAAEWERAKGHLRALVGIQGAYSLNRAPGDDSPAKWQVLSARVEAFIQDVEDHGLDE